MKHLQLCTSQFPHTQLREEHQKISECNFHLRSAQMNVNNGSGQGSETGERIQVKGLLVRIVQVHCTLKFTTLQLTWSTSPITNWHLQITQKYMVKFQSIPLHVTYAAQDASAAANFGAMHRNAAPMKKLLTVFMAIYPAYINATGMYSIFILRQRSCRGCECVPEW
jgi:hypothetical protein